MLSSRELVGLCKDSNEAKFLYYQKGIAVYKVYNPDRQEYWSFEVPIDGLDNMRLNATERAMTLVRWLKISNELGTLKRCVI